MHDQYHCACCEKVVESTEKECRDCGSHSIRSPYGLWIFCLVGCFVAALIVKGVHVYLQDHQEVPTHQSLFHVFEQDHKNIKH